MNKHLSVAVITPYNTAGGIAEYSEVLYSQVADHVDKLWVLANLDVFGRTRSDQENVLRLWKTGEQTFEYVLEWIATQRPDVVHIQQHAQSHFSLRALKHLIREVSNLSQPPRIFLTPHTVHSAVFDLLTMKQELALCEKILVHNQADLAHLHQAGIANVILFRQPISNYPILDKQELRQKLDLDECSPIVATHGLISDHKGLPQIIQSIGHLRKKYPNILLLSVNALNPNNVTSEATLEQMQQLITELNLSDNVRLFIDFLDTTTIVTLLQAADIGILAYQDVGESSSAAVRKFLACGLPTITTDIPMFNEFDEQVIKIADNSVTNISAGLTKLLEDTDLQQKLGQLALETAKDLSWSAAAKELVNLYSKPN